MELRAMLAAQVSAANCALCPISGGYVSFSCRHPAVCCGQMPDISWLRNVGIASIEILAPDPGGDFPTAYEEGGRRQTGGEGERTQAKSRSLPDAGTSARYKSAGGRGARARGRWFGSPALSPLCSLPVSLPPVSLLSIVPGVIYRMWIWAV